MKKRRTKTDAELWLGRAWHIDREINTLLEEQSKALLAAEGVSSQSGSTGEKVQTSKRNTTEDRFIKYAAYSELINKRIDDLVDVKTEIMKAVECVDDARLRIILMKRYIKYMKFREIADSEYTDIRNVYRLHNKAIEKINKIIKNVKFC